MSKQRTYFYAQANGEQEFAEINGSNCIILPMTVYAKDSAGKKTPIEPYEDKLFIFQPDRDNASFSVDEQIDMLVESIAHWNPSWDGDMADLGLKNFKFSVVSKNGKEYKNLAGKPGAGKQVDKAEGAKAWGAFTRKAKKRRPLPASTPEPTPAPFEPASTEAADSPLGEDPF